MYAYIPSRALFVPANTVFTRLSGTPIHLARILRLIPLPPTINVATDTVFLCTSPTLAHDTLISPTIFLVFLAFLGFEPIVTRGARQFTPLPLLPLRGGGGRGMGIGVGIVGGFDRGAAGGGVTGVVVVIVVVFVAALVIVTTLRPIRRFRVQLGHSFQKLRVVEQIIQARWVIR